MKPTDAETTTVLARPADEPTQVQAAVPARSAPPSERPVSASPSPGPGPKTDEPTKVISTSKNEEPVGSTSEKPEASEPAKDDVAAEETAPDKTMTLPEFAGGEAAGKSHEDGEPDATAETEKAERPKPSPGRPMPRPNSAGRPVRSGDPSARKS